MSLLSPDSFSVKYREPLNPSLQQRLADFFQFERFDDGFDAFHK
jgi:hypothetical protein